MIAFVLPSSEHHNAETPLFAGVMNNVNATFGIPLPTPGAAHASLASEQMLWKARCCMPISLTLPSHPVHPLLAQLG